VAQTAARLKEAQKLGFVRAVLPEAARAEAIAEPGLSLQSVGSLASLVADIAGQRSEVRGRRSDERGQRPEVAGRKVDVR
jgi:DNA repair protein RadA/Sms